MTAVRCLGSYGPGGPAQSQVQLSRSCRAALQCCSRSDQLAGQLCTAATASWCRCRRLRALPAAAAALLLLAVTTRGASHASYAKLYKDFDQKGLSDGYACTDVPATLNATLLSSTKQTSAEACRKLCRFATFCRLHVRVAAVAWDPFTRTFRAACLLPGAGRRSIRQVWQPGTALSLADNLSWLVPAGGTCSPQPEQHQNHASRWAAGG